MSARPHAFVAMPFGVKAAPAGFDGTTSDPQPQIIDFNRVYSEYIRPALELAGLEPFRADEETRAGHIITDMFQELLVADLVVADLTIENPNVWYELGVRHALRARGVVIVCGGRVTTAFDLYTDRKLRYALKDGAPDPTYLEERQEEARRDGQGDDGRLARPQDQSGLPPDAQPAGTGLEVAADRRCPRSSGSATKRGSGGSISLARPGGSAISWCWQTRRRSRHFASMRGSRPARRCGRAGRFQFALEHLQHGLDRDPRNLDILRETGMCLQRLALAGAEGYSLERARQHYRTALEMFPRDAETWALLGRVDKDAWTATWDREDQTPAQKRDAAAYEDALLRAAIDSYTSGLPDESWTLLLRYQCAHLDAPLPPPHRQRTI